MQQCLSHTRCYGRIFISYSQRNALMSVRIANIVTLVCVATVCTLVGLYIGMNHRYDALMSELPAMVAEVACSVPL